MDCYIRPFYVMAINMFKDWINSVDKNQSVLEKAQQELVYNRYTDDHTFWQTVLNWLDAAYNKGYNDHKKETVKKEKTLV